MTKVSAAAVVAEGEKLLATVEAGKVIPYVPNGMTLNGMDCQGLCEYLLIEAGVPKSECGLAGALAHWRACLWTGTPEECVAQFGRIPYGAWVFIHVEGWNEKYGDDLGTAEHMGIVLNGCALHASGSRKCVARSKFEGRTIPNGGWNAIGLPPWVDYGITSEGQNQPVLAPEDAGTGLSGDASAGAISAPLVRYARVFAADGGAVKLRPQPKKDKLWWLVATGVRVSVERSKGGWALIRAVCTDGAMRRAWMMEDFLQYEE